MTIITSAPTASSFCLHVAYDTQPRSRSIYLAPDQPSVPTTPIHDGPWSGIRTAAGTLLTDPKTGQWTLRTNAGDTLIPPSPLPALNTADTPALTMEIPALHHSQLYGPGDSADALLQTHAHSHLGNGHAVIPYYVSPAGYAALGISSDDDAPPSWDASENAITWTFPGKTADLYLLPAPTLKAATAAFAQLTGPAPVPPRWTLGYLQSRWGWTDPAYITDTAHQFATRHLPVDAFIFDFEWYTPTPDYTVKAAGLPDFQDFSFNPALFPDPAAQIAALHQQGIHVVGIRKPRLGNADSLTMARDKSWILPAPREAHDKNINARVLDFANQDVRHWYADHLTPLLQQGIDGWWNDEGELTFTTYHHWNNAEVDTLHAYSPTARPWSINRAFSPGLARTGAAAWTGDIRSTWEDLHKTPTTLLNWSFAGMPYVACDIGGFSGNVTPKLLTRWMQAGVFFPIMRAHSTLNEKPHFPWLFGDQAEKEIVDALHLRYQLIPYYYTLAHENHDTGLPLMRPLAMEFPNDPQCNNLSDEWLMGDSFLAAPYLTESDTRVVYLPSGENWYTLHGTTPLPGGQTIIVSDTPIPAYIRAGTILPLAPATLEHIDNLPGGPLTLEIYPGKDAAFTLIEDDGLTTGYLQGHTRCTTFRWNDSTRTLTWNATGDYDGKDRFRSLQIQLMTPTAPVALDRPLTPAGTVTFP